MPFRTPHGNHYHMLEGCCGATIPCGTEGLDPCSICGEGSLGAVTASMAIGSPGFGDLGAGSPGGNAVAHPVDMSTSDIAARLRTIAGPGAIPSIATHPAPPALSTETITQMLSTGMFSSVDIDPQTGVISFKVNMGQLPQNTASGGTSTTPDGRETGSAMSPKSKGRDYDHTDTQDAMREIRGGHHNSMESHILPDGSLSPEREAIHRQIIDDILSGKVPVDGRATFRMLGGGPASGKSSVTKTGCVEELDERSTVDVDSDLIKTMLPGYADMSAMDSNAARYFHEESSALAKRLMRVALGENYNVTLDGTGNGSVSSVRRKIAQARQAGYKVSAVYVTIGIDTALERNKARYRRGLERGENPRIVPPQIVINIHKSVSSILPQVAADFDEIELYDNNGPRGSKPVLIATGGSGEGLTPVPSREREFFEFLNKR